MPSFSNSGSSFLSNRFVSALLSDWGIGVYINYDSATRLNRPSSNGTVPLSQFLGYGPGSAQLKIDQAPFLKREKASLEGPSITSLRRST